MDKCKRKKSAKKKVLKLGEGGLNDSAKTVGGLGLEESPWVKGLKVGGGQTKGRQRAKPAHLAGGDSRGNKTKEINA